VSTLIIRSFHINLLLLFNTRVLMERKRLLFVDLAFIWVFLVVSFVEAETG